MSLLSIQLLDNFRLVYDGTPINRLQPIRQQALLAYLILHRDAPQPRRHLAYLFWPDSSESQAQANLRQLLHHIRHALPASDRYLQLNTRTVQWLPANPVHVDLVEFARCLEQAAAAERDSQPIALRAALAQAIDQYHGDLLPTCYDDWLLSEREHWREKYTDALDRLATLLEQSHDFAVAIGYAQRLLRHDPLHETTYRRLMRLYAANGERASALRTYHTCVTVLERELGVAPDVATHAAYVSLLDVEPQAAARHATRDHVVDLIGRKVAWDILQTTWRSVLNGRAHLLFLAGEAGIGKTRLIDEWLRWAGQQGIITTYTRSYAAEGDLAYSPVIEWLRSETLQVAHRKLGAAWLAELSRLLPELLAQYPELPRPEPLGERWQREHLFEAMVRAVLKVEQPLLLVLDDLQWCDQETLAWLHYFLRVAGQCPLLVLGAARTEEVDLNAPLVAMLDALRGTRQLTEIVLPPLDMTESTELTSLVADRTLDPQATALVCTQSAGNPLYIIETTRRAMEKRAGEVEASHAPAFPTATVATSLPSQVQMVIESRLKRLTPTARDLASLAAVIGRAFTFRLLREASGDDELTVMRGLDELWRRRIIQERGAHTYDFSHDFIREIAQTALGPVRRPILHLHVAQAIERLYASDLDAWSAQLAAHYTDAGDYAQAIQCYQRAAQVARRMFANVEAHDYLMQGLALLKTLPDTRERMQTELALHMALGPVLILSKGFSAPDVVGVYTRARELCESIHEQTLLFPALWGLWLCHFSRAEHRQARALASELLDEAERVRDHALQLEAHHASWTSLSYIGDFIAAREHCATASAIYDPQQHFQLAHDYGGHDAAVCCGNFHGPALWFLGYPDQALHQNQSAVELAKRLSHPFSLALALYWQSVTHQLRREAPQAEAAASAAIRIAQERNYPVVMSWATGVFGWALAVQGKVRKGLKHTIDGLAAYRATATYVDQTHMLALQAEAFSLAQEPAAGLRALAEAFAAMETTGEQYYAVELHRLKGELMLQLEIDQYSASIEDQAEACFRQAIEVARVQSAKSLELRATIGLCRLLQRQHRVTEAERTLATIYHWFTEGFITHDLTEARSLLEALRA